MGDYCEFDNEDWIIYDPITEAADWELQHELECRGHLVFRLKRPSVADHLKIELLKEAFYRLSLEQLQEKLK